MFSLLVALVFSLVVSLVMVVPGVAQIANLRPDMAVFPPSVFSSGRSCVFSSVLVSVLFSVLSSHGHGRTRSCVDFSREAQWPIWQCSLLVFSADFSLVFSLVFADCSREARNGWDGPPTQLKLYSFGCIQVSSPVFSAPPRSCCCTLLDAFISSGRPMSHSS